MLAYSSDNFDQIIKASVKNMRIKVATCIIEIAFSNFQNPQNIEQIKKYFYSFETKKGGPLYRIIFSDKKTEINHFGNIFYLKIDATLNRVIWLIRSILRKFLKDKGFFLHCSANAINDKKAIIFLGNPGVGKSTISMMLDGLYRKIVDDTAIVLKRNGYFYIYQIPFRERNILSKKGNGYKISTVFFLKKSKLIKIVQEENIFRNMPKFFKQIWLDRTYIKHQFRRIINFVETVPFFTLLFSKNNPAVINFFKHTYNYEPARPLQKNSYTHQIRKDYKR